MNKRLIKNNKGFSLLELLIVCAIFAIMVGIIGLSIATVHNANVGAAARKLDSMFAQARSTAISKGAEAGRLVLTREADGLYGKIGDQEPERICGKQIDIGIQTYSSVTDYNNYGYDWWLSGSIPFEFTPAGVVEHGSWDICRVYFVNGRRTVATTIYRETGKHKTEIR